MPAARQEDNMARKTYIVDGRQFQSEADYKAAMYDKVIIDKLRGLSKDYDVNKLRDLLQKIENRQIRFKTLLGQDYEDELKARIRKMSAQGNAKSGAGAKATARNSGSRRTSEQEMAFQAAVEEELRKRERMRKLFLVLSGLLAIGFLGIFGIYIYQQKSNEYQQNKLGELKGVGIDRGADKDGSDPVSEGSVTITRTQDKDIPEVLEEYKVIYQQHKKLIGWLKFDDKDIGGKYGFPVMQTEDNEFFLSHNSELKSDKNGAIFLDTNCDVLKPSTNFILYGHHMKSGAMFGNLDHYAKESYWKKYPYVSFDTIYEKGIYQVMYVFRSHVFSEEEIAFKYYQFTDCISATEFDSYMEEMAKMSLYDTGVTAQFGDQLLTLSTCDYQEQDGRFVVVCKKVKARQ